MAMACGSAAIVSRAGANLSTAGDAALAVDPDDVDQLHAALERVLEDRQERERLVAAGLTRASEFTWRVTARKTLEAYRAAAGEGAT